MQWMTELFHCEKYHERIISTTVATMENDAEGSMHQKLFVTAAVTLAGLGKPTFYCSSRSVDQVQRFSETQFYPLLCLLEGP